LGQIGTKDMDTIWPEFDATEGYKFRRHKGNLGRGNTEGRQFKKGEISARECCKKMHGDNHRKF